MSMVLGLVVVAVIGWMGLIVLRRSTEVADDEDAERRLEDAARYATERQGGGPDRPLCVESAAEIEPRMEREPCLWCNGSVHVEAHEVEEHEGVLLRRVAGKCGGCGRSLVTWFHLRSALPN
jgi:hypothetical protein